MSKREFSSLAIKLVGVYILAQHLCLLPGAIIAFFSVQPMSDNPLMSLDWRLMMLITPITGLFVGTLMMISSDAVAARLIRNDGEFTAGITLSYEEVLSIGFCCIGLLTLVDALPKIFSSLANFLRFAKISGCSPLQPQVGFDAFDAHISTVVRHVIQALIGLALLLKPHRLAKACCKHQNDNENAKNAIVE
jgi:hypothetical protein